MKRIQFTFDIEPKIKLEIFEGPLDLLLHLIRKNKMDVYDIKIADITQQYLDYLDFMRSLDINIASEFLVMAATLMNIKSRMLLPRPEEDLSEEEVTIDDLVNQLLEYQKYKEVATQLDKMKEDEERYFPRVPIFDENKKDTKPELKVSIFDLLMAVKALIEKDELPNTGEIEFSEIKIEDKINYIYNQLKNADRVLFSDLFVPKEGRYGISATFVALLELLKTEKIKVYQNRTFGPIWIGFKGKISNEQD